MSASEAETVLTQNQQFVLLRDAAAAVGIKLVFGEQGAYWLSHGNHCTPFTDLAAVRRALVEGYWLHKAYPTLKRVVIQEPEPPPPPAKAPVWVREIVEQPAAPKPPPRQPRTVAELKAMLDRRRAQVVGSDEWWRKDPTPQNRKKQVQR